MSYPRCVLTEDVCAASLQGTAGELDLDGWDMDIRGDVALNNDVRLEEDVVVRQALVSLNTSTGNQTVTIDDLGDLVPRGALFFLVGATINGTIRADAALSYGCADWKGNQWYSSGYAEDNDASNPQHTRAANNDACMRLIDGSASVVKASFVEFVPGGVTFNITATDGAAYKAIVVLFAGTDVQCAAGKFTVPDSGAHVDIMCGFRPRFVLGGHQSNVFSDSVATGGDYDVPSFGAMKCDDNGTAISEWALGYIAYGVGGTATVYFYLDASAVFCFQGAAGAPTWSAYISQTYANGFRVSNQTGNTTTQECGYFAVSTGQRQANVYVNSTPGATGDASDGSAGFEPQWVCRNFSELTATDTAQNVDGWGFYSFDHDHSEASVSRYEAHGETTSNTCSLVDTFLNQDAYNVASLVNLNDASLVSLDRTGHTLNWSNANPTPRYYIEVAVEQTPSTSFRFFNGTDEDMGGGQIMLDGDVTFDGWPQEQLVIDNLDFDYDDPSTGVAYYTTATDSTRSGSGTDIDATDDTNVDGGNTPGWDFGKSSSSTSTQSGAISEQSSSSSSSSSSVTSQSSLSSSSSTSLSTLSSSSSKSSSSQSSSSSSSSLSSSSSTSLSSVSSSSSSSTSTQSSSSSTSQSSVSSSSSTSQSSQSSLSSSSSTSLSSSSSSSLSSSSSTSVSSSSSSSSIIYHLPVSVSTTVGTVVTGTVNDARQVNSVYYQVAEVTGTPGFAVAFTFQGIPTTLSDYDLHFHGRYVGSPGHVVQLRVWNFTLAQWDATGATLTSSATDGEQTFNLPGAADYLSGGEARVQWYHSSPGNVTHDLYVDLMELVEAVSSSSSTSTQSSSSTSLSSLSSSSSTSLSSSSSSSQSSSSSTSQSSLSSSSTSTLSSLSSSSTSTQSSLSSSSSTSLSSSSSSSQSTQSSLSSSSTSTLSSQSSSSSTSVSSSSSTSVSSQSSSSTAATLTEVSSSTSTSQSSQSSSSQSSQSSSSTSLSSLSTSSSSSIIFHLPSDYTLITGTVGSGSLNDTRQENSVFLRLDEEVGVTPGIQVEFNFYEVPNLVDYDLKFVGYYDGDDPNLILAIYDWVGTHYDPIQALPAGQAGPSTYQIALPDGNEFLGGDGNNVRIAFYSPETGDPNHHLFIDLLELVEAVSSSSSQSTTVSEISSSSTSLSSSSVSSSSSTSQTSLSSSSTGATLTEISSQSSSSSSSQSSSSGSSLSSSSTSTISSQSTLSTQSSSTSLSSLSSSSTSTLSSLSTLSTQSSQSTQSSSQSSSSTSTLSSQSSLSSFSTSSSTSVSSSSTSQSSLSSLSSSSTSQSSVSSSSSTSISSSSTSSGVPLFPVGATAVRICPSNATSSRVCPSGSAVVTVSPIGASASVPPSK